MQASVDSSQLSTEQSSPSSQTTGVPATQPEDGLQVSMPLQKSPSLQLSGVPGRQPGLPGDGGYQLHAHRLALVHPATGARLELECAPPPALREA